MNSLEKKQRVLLITAPLLCFIMFGVMPLSTSLLGKTAGFITGFCIYWFFFCVPITIFISNGPGQLKEIYRQETYITPVSRNMYYLLALLPCLVTFLAVFKSYILTVSLLVLFIAFLFAMINGTIEEMYWRGAFNKAFGSNTYLAFLYPSLFFGIWHIALTLANGMVYHGGFLTLVGGSFLMGIIWGWVAFKTKSINIVTTAHIVTNFFTFTVMIYQNWFI